MFRETGSPTYQKQRPCQYGLSPVCLQSSTLWQRMPYPLPSTQSSHTLKNNNSSIRMLFVYFSSALERPHPWSWLENFTLWTIGLAHKQTLGSTDRQSYSSTLAFNTGAPEGRVLKVNNTKKLTVDFREKEAKTHTLVYNSGAEAEQVNRKGSPPYWDLGRAIPEQDFFTGQTKSILTGNITNWQRF